MPRPWRLLLSLLLLGMTAAPLWAQEAPAPGGPEGGSLRADPARLDRDGLLRLLQDDERFSARALEVRERFLDADRVAVGVGMTGGAFLVAGAMLLGAGQSGGSALLVSGAGATLLGAGAIGLGIYLGSSLRDRAIRDLGRLAEEYNRLPPDPPVRPADPPGTAARVLPGSPAPLSLAWTARF